MSELFSETHPSEPGWYWWRNTMESTPEPVWWDEDRVSLSMGLFGPRIPLPVAPPVECWAVTTDRGNGIEIASSAWKDLDTAKECQRISGEGHGIVRGVFVPTSVETSDE